MSALAQRLAGFLHQPGFQAAVPVLILLLIGFFGPLVLVAVFSFMPARSFKLDGGPTLENYRFAFEQSYYLSLLRSFAFAAGTVAVLALVCYPVALGMAKLFGRYAGVLTLVMVLPLFVSENVRLFGWVLFLLKGGGVLAGAAKAVFGIELADMLYSNSATLMGLAYVYLPFMLFPMVLGLSMVSRDVVEAASDLGASRWQIMREIELPLALPGLLIGGLLTFVLSLGSLTESKVLGGSKVIMIAADIESAFTYGQNWPLGSALSVLLLVLAGGLVLVVLSKLNLDAILKRR
ncbi:MAG: ABC transporter permease [Alphaproteobacteria bacterium]|nr:ABC transporter permease [Alphaproteobacteria bacterium]